MDLTREQIETKKRRLHWMMSGDANETPPTEKLTLEEEVALCDLALAQLEVIAAEHPEAELSPDKLWEQARTNRQPPQDEQALDEEQPEPTQEDALAGLPEPTRRLIAWIAVSHWAANELLSCLVELQSASDERAAALRSRAKTLRELLTLPEELEQPKFAEHDPHIP